MPKEAIQFYHATRQFFRLNGNHTLLTSEDPRDESVQAKWAELQSLESDLKPRFSSPRRTNNVTDTSLSSIASSGSGTSSDSGAPGSSSKNRFGGAKIKWKQVKKGSMKKINSLTNRLSFIGPSKPDRPSTAHQVPNVDVVSTAPDGGWVSSVIPKIQASKSMQNLEQITRDSYYNLRGATANLKDKCNSFVELSQAKNQYNELWDEESDENEDFEKKQRVMLQKIGLY